MRQRAPMSASSRWQERLDAGARGDLHILEYTVRADADGLRELTRLRTRNWTSNGHVAPAGETAAHVDTRRIRECDPFLHQGSGYAALEPALEPRKLCLAVHA